MVFIVTAASRSFIFPKIGIRVMMILDKPIPDLIAWIFFVGLIIAIITDLLRLKK